MDFRVGGHSEHLCLCMFSIHLLLTWLLLCQLKLPIGGTKTSRKRTCGQHIREIEHVSYTPVILSATGGLAHEATFSISVSVASLLAQKEGNVLCFTLTWKAAMFIFYCFISNFHIYIY